MIEDEGFTRSYRRRWRNPVFRNLRDAAVWAWMTDVAAWRETSVRFGDRQVRLRRGQLVTSERFIAEGFCMDRQVARRVLDSLEAEKMIAREKTSGGTIITLVNYDRYQAQDAAENQTQVEPTANPRPHQQQTHGHDDPSPSVDSVIPPDGQAENPRDIPGPPRASTATNPNKNEGKEGTEESSPNGEDARAPVALFPVEQLPDDATTAFKLWNELAAWATAELRRGLPTSKRRMATVLFPVGAQRRSQLKRLLKSHGLDGWKRTLANIRGSPGVRGFDGWVIQLDWLIKEENFIKVFEGQYDGWDASGKRRNSRGSGAIGPAFGHDDLAAIHGVVDRELEAQRRGAGGDGAAPASGAGAGGKAA